MRKSIAVHEDRLEDMLKEGFTFVQGACAQDWGGERIAILYFLMNVPKPSYFQLIVAKWHRRNHVN